MLKIKDNVNLKVLEKYGFDTTASPEVQGIDKIDFSNNWVDDHFGMIIGNGLVIWESSREITNWDNGNLDILYDLIQAGLVEKVDVPNNERNN